MAILSPNPFQVFDDDGVPLAAGTLGFYEDGTSTPKTVYADADATTPLANPVTLDAGGRANVFLGSGFYKIICKDVSSNIIWQVDKVQGSQSTTGATAMATVENIAALRALSPDAYGAVLVRGYYAKSDGGGGMFVWDATNTDADDFGTIIEPDAPSGSGRWVRQFAGDVNIKWFGCQPGSGDQTASLLKASAYTDANGLALYVPAAGTYLIDGAIGDIGTVVFDPYAILQLTTNANNAKMTPVINTGDVTQHFSVPSNVVWTLNNTILVRPEWFGALGDGVSDDTEAFAATVNALPDQTGCEIHLNAGGVYAIADASGFQLVSRSGLKFIGNFATVKKTTNAGQIFSIQGCTHIEVEQLLIDGNNGLATHGFVFDEEGSVPCEKITMHDVYIGNCGLGMLCGNYSDDSNDNGIKDSTFYDVQLQNNTIAIRCDAMYNDGVQFINTQIDTDTGGHDIEIFRGNLDFLNLTVDSGGGAKTTGWVFYIKDGAAVVNSGHVIFSSFKGMVYLAAQTKTARQTFSGRAKKTSFTSFDISAPGTSSYSGISDYVLMHMVDGSRDASIEDSNWNNVPGNDVANIFEMSIDGAGLLTTSGNRFNVLSETDTPYKNTVTKRRSVGDIYFVWTVSGGGHVMAELPAPEYWGGYAQFGGRVVKNATVDTLDLDSGKIDFGNSNYALLNDNETQLKWIKTEGWTAGSIIHLQMVGRVEVVSRCFPLPSGYAEIALYYAPTRFLSASDILAVQFDGLTWIEIGYNQTGIIQSPTYISASDVSSNDLTIPDEIINVYALEFEANLDLVERISSNRPLGTILTIVCPDDVSVVRFTNEGTSDADFSRLQLDSGFVENSYPGATYQFVHIKPSEATFPVWQMSSIAFSHNPY